MPPASSLPVLLLGENHNQTRHYLIERDTLREARGFGYDTLALEWPQGYEWPLETYLASDRTKRHFDRFVRSREADPSKKPTPLHPQALKTMWLAEDAADLGYRVICADASAQDRYPRPGEGMVPWNNRRNHHMAERLAREVRHGHGVVMGTGSNHILTSWSENHLLTVGPGEYLALPTLLERKGLSVRSFLLDTEGEETWQQARLAASRTAASLARSGREIAAGLREELGSADFQRVPPIPGPHWGVWTRRPETRRKACERDPEFYP